VDAGQVYGRGIAFPPYVGTDGRVAFSAGEVNVRESIQIILRTDFNERLMQPDFGGGLGPLLFEPNIATTRQLIANQITAALGQWEPRINVESVDVEPDLNDPQAVIVAITYQLVATQAREQVNLGLALVS
jgi:phage baseplate assembly protein W